MPNDILTRAIDALASGHDLPREQAGAVLGEIMRGDASESQIAAFLIALRTKGETVDELAGLAGTMRALATPVPCERGDLVERRGLDPEVGRGDDVAAEVLAVHLDDMGGRRRAHLVQAIFAGH